MKKIILILAILITTVINAQTPSIYVVPSYADFIFGGNFYEMTKIKSTQSRTVNQTFSFMGGASIDPTYQSGNITNNPNVYYPNISTTGVKTFTVELTVNKALNPLTLSDFPTLTTTLTTKSVVDDIGTTHILTFMALQFPTSSGNIGNSVWTAPSGIPVYYHFVRIRILVPQSTTKMIIIPSLNELGWGHSLWKTREFYISPYTNNPLPLFTDKVKKVKTSLGTFDNIGTNETTSFTQNATNIITYSVTMPYSEASKPCTFSLIPFNDSQYIQSYTSSSSVTHSNGSAKIVFQAPIQGGNTTKQIAVSRYNYDSNGIPITTFTTTYSCNFFVEINTNPEATSTTNSNLATLQPTVGTFASFTSGTAFLNNTSPNYAVTDYEMTTNTTFAQTYSYYIYLPYQEVTTLTTVPVPTLVFAPVSTHSTTYYYKSQFIVTPNYTQVYFTNNTQNYMSKIVCVAQNTSYSTTYLIFFKIAPKPIPITPSNLYAEPSSSSASINLQWEDVDFESGYRIYRNGTYIGVKGANITTHTDVGVSFENTYTYTVTAYNTAGTSANSNEAIATTINNPTAAPTNLTGNTITTNPLHVDLTWTDNANNETKYRVFRNNAQLVELDANTTSYTDNNVFWNTTYSYEVKAWHTTTGYSNPSNTLSIVIGDNPTGISEINNTKIKLYPNPASNELSIQSEEIIKEVLIYNSQGKLVKTETKNTIDVSDLAKGIYFVNINNAQQKISFIKE